MLIVYDFEGGGGTPVITLRRWLTDPTDPAQADYFTDPNSPCDVDANSPPCRGDAVNLTNLGFAEAKVNTGTTVTDLNTPPTSGTTSGSSTLGDSEFGEAGINLTDAGVFSPDICTGFGKTYAVSRSSGNSGTAQMKDLVGPGNISIANCGTVTVKKVTKDTSGNVITDDSTQFTFNTNVKTCSASSTTCPDDVAEFKLTGQPSPATPPDTKVISDFLPGTYRTISETCRRHRPMRWSTSRAPRTGRPSRVTRRLG